MKNWSLLLLIFSWFFLLQNPLLGKILDSDSIMVEQENLQFAQGKIQIVEGKMVIGESLQKELGGEIIQAKKELENLTERFAIEVKEEIGIYYLHQGNDDWKLDGISLNIESEIMLSTAEIFSLKEYFEQTESLEIEGEKYQTTGWMRQLGPILHF